MIELRKNIFQIVFFVFIYLNSIKLKKGYRKLDLKNLIKEN
jgi:hypothetical protein